MTRRPERRPLRAVVKSELWSGRGSLVGPSTSRRGRTYQLFLDCGHAASRAAHYGPPSDGRAPQVGGTQHRLEQDVLPPPQRARCGTCVGILEW